MQWLHGKVDHVQWRAIQRIRELRTDHVMAHGIQVTYSKFMYHAWKIPCISTVTLVCFKSGFHRSEVGWVEVGLNPS